MGADVNDVERIWRSSRPRPHLRRPSAGTVDVLLALRAVPWPLSGPDITPVVGRCRGNVSRWLRTLGAHGFADIDFVVQGSAGGRAAEFWVLTELGRVLAEALLAELVTR